MNVLLAAPDRLRMRPWERGSGATAACGTGGCAVVVAGVVLFLTSSVLPRVLDRPVEMVARTALPLALITLGAGLDPGDVARWAASEETAAALADGADLLVIGRPLTRAPDRGRALARLEEELLRPPTG